jgi:hypothetical protein
MKFLSNFFTTFGIDAPISAMQVNIYVMVNITLQNKHMLKPSIGPVLVSKREAANEPNNFEPKQK